MNPNAAQAVENEEAGIEEMEEDIDYDAIYGGIDIPDVSKDKSAALQNSYAKIFGDVAKQGVKETLIGAGGTYGDLLELAGLGGQSPGEEARNTRDFETLSRMQEPGYQPSLEDISSLSEGSEGPQSFRLPTSNDLRSVNESLGGPGEAETPQGKYAARAGKLYGSGLAFGQVNPIPAVAAGTAGQAVEDFGGGPILQTAAEIATLLATQGKSGALSSSKKSVQEKIDSLRKLGYADEDITLAINAAYKNGKRTQIASKGAKTEKAFEDFANKSDKIVSDIISGEVPGIEKGTKFVHEMASDAYGQVAKEAAGITITNSKPFLDASKKVVDQLQNTLGKNPEAQAFIKRISEAAMDATQYPSAEKMMNFYKELNSMGNWLGRNQKDRLITQMKDGIKETFRKEGKQGSELATKFEKANKGIQKAYKAEEMSELLQKVTTQDGIDYKKMSKLFDKKENVELFKDVLGPTQSKNIELIAKTGKEIKDFDKAWKSVNNIKIGTGADLARAGLGSYYIYHGDWQGLAAVVATKAGTGAIKKLAEKSLTDPKFQNLLIRGLHAIKVSSPQTFKSVQSGMKKYFDEEGIDIPLD
jgi:hypothetical protein